uniref:Fatty acid synthase beta subunit AflB /Fas1-like central domain-containing protein n=1 Tax=Peronospora matthiolae TaxID=2874970 RepID=A0AAV1T722_9STRA
MMPSMNVMLQWTASRVVSSLSPEDFHEPMEVTHAAICRVPNVLLVVGSGLEWETRYTGVVDGVVTVMSELGELFT